MLTTEHPWSSTASTCPPTYELRLHGGTSDERLIAIPPGKHSIGSGARCSLRLQYDGVQPLECLIVHDDDGLRVRRWSESARVNGQTFEDTRLTAGDVLQIGPVALEIVEPRCESPDAEEAWTAAESWQPEGEVGEQAELPAPADDQPALEEAPTAVPVDEEHQAAAESHELETLELQTTEPNSDWEMPPESGSPQVANTADALEAVAVPESDESDEVKTPQPARRRKRRVMAVLHRQRQEYDELVARVNDLEKKIEIALVDPAVTGLPSADEARDAAQQVETAVEPHQQHQALESELSSLHVQLAKRDAELSQARYSIDLLERQLIDSQHTMHAFAEERLTWEKQFDELESRLAEYVERIQELERQLDQVRAAQADSSPSPEVSTTDWATEAAGEEATADAADLDVVETAIEPAWEELAARSGTTEEVVEEPATTEVAAPSVETVEAGAAPDVSETVSETADESPADESPEVGAALDHLRGLAIWREEPQVVAGPSGDAPQQAADDAESSPKGPETASFIDRYAHLFPSDDSSAEPPAPAAETSIHAAATAHDSVVDPSASGADEEESVEQYMAKLLERMRGPSSGDSAEAADYVAPQAVPAPQQPESATASDALDPTTTVHEPFTELTELKSKAGVTELASDRKAMRELAMQSARHAIGVHTSRKLRRSARTRCIIALLGAAVGFYLLLNAPGWKSLQFAAGCVAAITALYWGKLTFSTLLQGIRLGAFNDYEEEIDVDKAIHPPLPIDVEHRMEIEPPVATEEAPSSSADPI